MSFEGWPEAPVRGEFEVPVRGDWTWERVLMKIN
jgi:hypothetical protein